MCEASYPLVRSLIFSSQKEVSFFFPIEMNNFFDVEVDNLLT